MIASFFIKNSYLQKKSNPFAVGYKTNIVMDLIIYSGNKIDKSMSTIQSPEKKTLILQAPRTERSHNKHEVTAI